MKIDDPDIMNLSQLRDRLGKTPIETRDLLNTGVVPIWRPPTHTGAPEYVLPGKGPYVRWSEVPQEIKDAPKHVSIVTIPERPIVIKDELITVERAASIIGIERNDLLELIREGEFQAWPVRCVVNSRQALCSFEIEWCCLHEYVERYAARRRTGVDGHE